MRFNLRSALILFVCLILSFQNAWGWNSIGHMTVAYVAYQQLTPEVKARTATLLKLNPDYKKWLSYIPAGTSDADQEMYVFMMAATWPDEIKTSNSGYKNDSDTPPNTAEATKNTGYSDHYMHKYWHFIDLPFTQDGTAPLPAVPVPNAQTQITALRKYIASAEKDKLKSYDLVWLMHLVGDVHQPLHASTRVSQGSLQGDAGGNSVKIDISPKELHGYWDDLLGNGSTENYTTALKAALLLPPADPTAAADVSEADWVNESFALAKSNVYVDPPIGVGLGPFSIGANPTYGSDSLAVAQKQIALAGVRLAKVLNAELK